jgi:hypothetical protein
MDMILIDIFCPVCKQIKEKAKEYFDKGYATSSIK